MSCKRDEQCAVHGLSSSDLVGALQELAALCEPVEVHFRWRPRTSDPGDDLVLEAAVNGRADYLVMHDIRDFVGSAAEFELRVVTPGAFLARMRS